MKQWNHLNFEKRKIIASRLARKDKLVVIADLVDIDPSALSKEIKRNRMLTKKGIDPSDGCKMTTRFPHCCNACTKKYYGCPFNQYKYDASHAQNSANFRLKNSRIGINMTEEEFGTLDSIIKDGIDRKESVYHIVHDNPEVTVSVPTVYRYINDGKLTTKRMDLPYAVTYKKRKNKKAYEYKENSSIDRSNRTYVDFLAFMHKHRNQYHVQMDFLGSIKTDKKSILTMTIPDLHYVMLFIIDSPNKSKIQYLFDTLEDTLHFNNFMLVFPCILTDRDPCFSDFNAIEESHEYEAQRTSIFYCDSFKSSQKANIEQMNKQLRKFFPKGKSIDHRTPESVCEICNIINKSRIQSLTGSSPNEAFTKVYGEKLLNQLNSIIIDFQTIDKSSKHK